MAAAASRRDTEGVLAFVAGNLPKSPDAWDSIWPERTLPWTLGMSASDPKDILSVATVQLKLKGGI